MFEKGCLIRESVGLLSLAHLDYNWVSFYSFKITLTRIALIPHELGVGNTSSRWPTVIKLYFEDLFICRRVLFYVYTLID